jgi:MFS family permease
MYGLACISSVHWVVPVIAITIFMFAGSVIYIGSFTYLADCYGIYASSAVAGSALCRNIAATALPLFTRQMYDALSYRWANILFAGIGLLMAPVPLILFYFGPKIRARSNFARQLELSNETKEKEGVDVSSTTATVAEEGAVP